MAKFVAGQPIVTIDSTISVDAGLPVGRHRFRLEVVTDTGQRSVPDEVVVQVQTPEVLVAPAPNVVSPSIPIAPVPIREVQVQPAPPHSLSRLPGSLAPGAEAPDALSGSTSAPPSQSQAPHTAVPRSTRKKKKE